VPAPGAAAAGATLLGVRPEYVTLESADAPGTIPAVVTQAQDIGTYWLVSARIAGSDTPIRLRVNPARTIPRVGDAVRLGVVGTHTCFYRDEKLIEPEVVA